MLLPALVRQPKAHPADPGNRRGQWIQMGSASRADRAAEPPPHSSEIRGRGDENESCRPGHPGFTEYSGVIGDEVNVEEDRANLAPDLRNRSADPEGRPGRSLGPERGLGVSP